MYRSAALAENRWVELHSKSGAYNVKAPNDYEADAEELRLTPEVVAHSEKLLAKIDQRPFRNITKIFSVTVNQTIGLPFTIQESRAMIEADIDYYKNQYAKFNPIIKYTQREGPYGIPIYEIFIAYTDPEKGPQNVRAAIFTTDISRYQQVFFGPERSMFEIKVNSFFEDMDIKNGIAKSEGSFEKDWKEYVSPLNIFTAYFPPATKKFGDAPPSIVHNDFNERISYTFKDPAREQDLYYRITAYKTDRALQFPVARQILSKQHAQTYKLLQPNIEIESNRDDIAAGKAEKLTLALWTDFLITPNEKAPYANTVKLYAEIVDKYMLVHELIGSYQLVHSPFTESLLKVAKFHPEKAELVEILGEKQKNKSAPALEKESQSNK